MKISFKINDLGVGVKRVLNGYQTGVKRVLYFLHRGLNIFPDPFDTRLIPVWQLNDTSINSMTYAPSEPFKEVYIQKGGRPSYFDISGKKSNTNCVVTKCHNRIFPQRGKGRSL